MTMDSMKALILDNQPIVRNALALMLKNISEQAYILHSNSIKTACWTLERENIDMIILDIDLSDGSGLDFIRSIRSRGYRGKVLFVSSNNHPLIARTAQGIGANGYILKTEATLAIHEAILATYQGNFVFKPCKARVPNLSKRETIVFYYLAQGRSNKEISTLLSLSTKTISTHKARILEKYNANSIIEVMSFQKL